MGKVYGIDLGTTNSLIGRLGECMSGLMPSTVDFSTNKTTANNSVGDSVFGSYKVDMTVGAEGDTPRKASSIVLESLSEFVKNETGEYPKEVVISVPAYFSNTQREAVISSAEDIGMEVRAIINEPTAASLKVCGNKPGLYVVYDLGGGTFDTTIIDTRLGTQLVVGSSGCILGGDDLDMAITDCIIKYFKIPIYQRTPKNKSALKACSLKLKFELQRAYEESRSYDYTASVEVPDFDDVDSLVQIPRYFSMSVLEYKNIVEKVFAETIKRVNTLIENNLMSDDVPELVFVGGSTNCRLLREFVCNNVEAKVVNMELKDKPDYTVAEGVVLYAKSIEDGVAGKLLVDVTKQLCIEDNNGMSVILIPDNTPIPCKYSKIMRNSNKTDRLVVKLYQGNNMVARDNEYQGSIIYDYDRVVEVGEGEVEVSIEVTSDGLIKLVVEDILNFLPPRSLELKRL